MSTICKIDPTVRAQRYTRAAAARTWAAMAFSTVTHKLKAVYYAAHMAMWKLALDSSVPGWWKHRRFMHINREVGQNGGMAFAA